MRICDGWRIKVREEKRFSRFFFVGRRESYFIFGLSNTINTDENFEIKNDSVCEEAKSKNKIKSTIHEEMMEDGECVSWVA